MQQSIQNIQTCRQLQAQWEEPYLKQIGCNSTVRALTLCTLYHLIKGTELILEHRLVPHAAFEPDACMTHLGSAKRASVQCSIEIMQATHAIYTSAAELFYHRNEAAHTGDSYVV